MVLTSVDKLLGEAERVSTSLIVQFPIADFRAVTGAPPQWTMGTRSGKDFVRSFGVVARREGGAIEPWVDGDHCARAYRGIRFHGNLAPHDTDLGKELKDLKCVDRRLVVQLPVAAVEVVFRGKLEPDRTLCHDDLVRIGAAALSMPVRVRVERGLIEDHSLGKCMSALLRGYVGATTRSPFTPNRQWAYVGTPLLVVNTTAGVRMSEPSAAKSIDSSLTPGIKLWHYYLHPFGSEVAGWTMAHSREADAAIVRRTYLCLLRLHAEHECFAGVLNAISNGAIPVEQESTQMTDYLLRAVMFLAREKKYDLHISGDIDAACRSLVSRRSELRQALEAQVAMMEPRDQQLVRGYLDVVL